MKKLLRLLIASVALMAIGGIIILVTGISYKEEIAALNAKFGYTIFEIDEPITSLSVNATDGTIYVMYGDNTRVTVDDCFLENVSVSVENGVLKVDQKFPETVLAAGWELPAYIKDCSSEHLESITITVPESLALNKAEFSMGKGDVIINGMNAYDLQIQVGIGDFTSKTVKNLRHYVYQVPFGKVDFNGFAE